MHIQLWSSNYEPEPTGIALLSTALAVALSEMGHRVEVVAAHPHYPEPRWGSVVRPYRETRDGVPVFRLPIWAGRASAAARIRQDMSFALALSMSAPLLPRPEAMLVVSPFFSTLGPAMIASRARRVPWVLWLQDILPDGATATGVLEEGPMVDAARRYERLAYRSASRIVVISESFRENLLAKDVPDEKIARVFNPASRPLRNSARPEEGIDPSLVLNMGNIGHSQGLEAVVRAFEADSELERLGARFTMAGDGVAGEEVRAAIQTDRVEVTGVISDTQVLDALLMSAAVGLVSQSYVGIDFNVPSKLMNFMGFGIPVVAAVRPDSEVARIVERSGCGWVASTPEECASTLARVLQDRGECQRRGAAGLSFARENFSPVVAAESIEAVLSESLGRV